MIRTPWHGVTVLRAFPCSRLKTLADCSCSTASNKLGPRFVGVIWLWLGYESLVESGNPFTPIVQGCFTDIGAIVQIGRVALNSCWRMWVEHTGSKRQQNTTKREQPPYVLGCIGDHYSIGPSPGMYVLLAINWTTILTENRQLSFGQHCRHCWHQRLPLCQPIVPPGTTQLVLWQLLVFSACHHDEVMK